MTKNLMRAIRKRNGFFRRARQNGSQSLFDRYKQQRNRVVKEMQKAKGHFFKNFNPSSSKQFWKTVKIMNKNNVSILALVRNGTTVTKDFDKASMLTQYFSKCFNMAQPPLSCRYEEPNIGNCPVYFLCTEEEVYEMLLSLDTSKANGPDGISAKMFKGTALSITPVLTQLFSMSIQSAWNIS